MASKVKEMAGYQTRTYRIEGVDPILMHNGQLANPRNSYAKSMKAISSKRNKTGDDFDELARLEFCGGLYMTDGNGKPCVPCWPGANVLAMIRDAG